MTSFRYRQCRTKRPWLCLCAGEEHVKSEGDEEDSLEADPMEKDEPGPFDQPIEVLTAQLQGLGIRVRTNALAVQARLRVNTVQPFVYALQAHKLRFHVQNDLDCNYQSDILLPQPLHSNATRPACKTSFPAEGLMCCA